MTGASATTSALSTWILGVLALSMLLLPALSAADVAGLPQGVTPTQVAPTQRPGVPGPRSVGFLLEDVRRYPTTSLAPRVLYDLGALPATVPRWQTTDWALFLGFTGATVALMLPTGPSPDVRIDRWITRNMDAWMPDLWAARNQAVLWTTLSLAGIATWSVALATDNERVSEAVSMVIEAVSVAEILHLSIKLLVGREGPRDGDGLGRLLGPRAAIRLYPAGTPSGHFASLYAVFAAGEAYLEPHWAISAVGHLVLGSLALTHVINHRHYLSDIVAGAAMGYATGHWGVRHRSSHYKNDLGSERGGVLRVRPTFTSRGLGLQVDF